MTTAYTITVTPINKYYICPKTGREKLPNVCILKNTNVALIGSLSSAAFFKLAAFSIDAVVFEIQRTTNGECFCAYQVVMMCVLRIHIEAF